MPPRVLQFWPSFYCIPSVASDAPVRGSGFTPGRSSPGASAVLLSAPDAPTGPSFYRILSVASDAPVRCTGFTPGRSNPGASAVLHSALDAPIMGLFWSYSLRCLGRSSAWHRAHPRTIQSGGWCRASSRPGRSNPGRLLYRILSVASDAPVLGNGFTPVRSSPGACAVLHFPPVAPIRGVFLSYSLRRLARSSPWRRVHPRTIQSGG